METCERCGRAMSNDVSLGWERCIKSGNHSCVVVRAAYLRGVRAGVQVSKENVRVADVRFDWSDVDRAIEEEAPDE